ncbi:MoaD/ThiS family protein [Pimelobacter simplex]|nr:MoaD/ThiS family protein [Pimelobacter simplex]
MLASSPASACFGRHRVETETQRWATASFLVGDDTEIRRQRGRVLDVSETQVIRVRYWAAARAAAGIAEEEVAVAGPVTLAELRAEVVGRHPGTRLPEVVGVCSVLVGERPVSSTDPAAVVVRPGETVEFLPPFAGG